jgi:hypothetical protein
MEHALFYSNTPMLATWNKIPVKGRSYHSDQYYPTSGIWQGNVIRNISMSEEQLMACLAARISQVCDEQLLTI